MITQQQGTVTAMSPHGFAFIVPDRAGGEVWLRPRGVSQSSSPLQEGQRVEYDLVIGAMGVEAANVRPVQP